MSSLKRTTSKAHANSCGNRGQSSTELPVTHRVAEFSQSLDLAQAVPFSEFSDPVQPGTISEVPDITSNLSPIVRRQQPKEWNRGLERDQLSTSQSMSSGMD